MDELISESYNNFNVAPAIAPIEVLLALLTSAVLCLFLAKIYQTTHEGYSYSKSFLHTIVIVGVTISLIMIIIGSNIARAFALVGAMSIIRFRNPVKDSRDVAFLFMAMAIGMAAGTKFYLLAAMFTVFSGALIIIFHFTGFGEVHQATYVIKVRLHAKAREMIEKHVKQYCRHVDIISIDRFTTLDGLEDVVYEVKLHRRQDYNTLLEQLSRIEEIDTINLMVGESSINA